jgi:hypothetical protein
MIFSGKDKSILWCDKLIAWSIILVFCKKGCGIVNIPTGPLSELMTYAFLAMSLVIFVISKGNLKIPIDWKTVCLILLLTLLMFRGTLTSTVVFPSVDFEIISSFALILVAVALSRIVVSCWDFFQLRCAGSSLLISFLGSVLGLKKFIDGTAGDFASLGGEGGISSSLTTDYNMSSLVILLGLIGGIYLSRVMNSVLIKRFILFLVVGASAVPLLSGSRRYLIFYVASCIIFAFVYFYNQIRNWSKLAQSARFVFVILGAILLGFPLIIVLLTLGWLDSLIDLSPSHPLMVVLKRYQTLGEIQSTMKESRGIWLERGLDIWDSYSSSQILFGGGFDYMEKMSEYASGDYPHNPVLSALLYSGVFGGLFVAWLIISPLFYLKKLFNSSLFVLGGYIASLFFSIVSGNSYASVFQLPFFCIAARVILWSEGIMHESGSDASCDDVAPAR